MRFKLKTTTQKLPADIITPVGIYLNVRDKYPNSLLLESSDYHGNDNSYSFICLHPIASFKLENNVIYQQFPDRSNSETPLTKTVNLSEQLESFKNAFDIQDENQDTVVNGLFGYMNYDAVQHFETLDFKASKKGNYQIPDIQYSVYQCIIAINHFNDEMTIIENNFEGNRSLLSEIKTILSNRNYGLFKFNSLNNESSNLTDAQYKAMITKGKEHCKRGDVFQIVLSRQFQQGFSGDEFNVYRALRSVNPSPYLFYFDYGNFKIMGSSPEAQIVIKGKKATIHPIAGTFKRTGNDETDKKLAQQLLEDPKENAEHVMLVDLARNDLGRNANEIKVESYKEVQYYSHVIHLVSKVSGQLDDDVNMFKVVGESFPAGTLSGAPKYKAMQLIDKYENQNRSFYGGAIGYLGFNGDYNHAIMIRSFMSKNNTLYYQAGAGVVIDSKEENELQEVNNKLLALKKAIKKAESF